VPLLLPVMAFLFVSLLIAAGAMALTPSATAIERRLGEVIGEAERAVNPSSTLPPVVMDWLRRLGAAAPRSASEMSKLQQRLTIAGYRSREAVVVFFGLRIVVTLAAFVILMSPIIRHSNLAVALAGAGAAYVLPGMVLARMAKKRQHLIRLGLADALDLLIVTVEAGLGLDQAIQRVSEELAFAHKDLTDELRLINLEIRAPASKMCHRSSRCSYRPTSSGRASRSRCVFTPKRFEPSVGSAPKKQPPRRAPRWCFRSSSAFSQRSGW